MGTFLDPGGGFIVQEEMSAHMRQTVEDGVRGGEKSPMTPVHGMKTMNVLRVLEGATERFAS